MNGWHGRLLGNEPRTSAWVAIAEAELVQLPLDMVIEDSADDSSAFSPPLGMIAAIQSNHAAQPITVTPLRDGTGRHRVAIGRCRVRPARLIGLLAVPAVICRSAQQCLQRLRSLLTPADRDQVNPVELALVLRRIWKDEPSVASQRQLSQMLGKDEAWVSRTLRILDLPEDLQARLVMSQVPISAQAVGEIAALQDRRWQQELIDALMAVPGATEQAIRRRIRQLKGKTSAGRFKASYRSLYQTTATLCSRFKDLTREQERAVILNLLEQCDRRREAEAVEELA